MYFLNQERFVRDCIIFRYYWDWTLNSCWQTATIGDVCVSDRYLVEDLNMQFIWEDLNVLIYCVAKSELNCPTPLEVKFLYFKHLWHFQKFEGSKSGFLLSWNWLKNLWKTNNAWQIRLGMENTFSWSSRRKSDGQYGNGLRPSVRPSVRLCVCPKHFCSERISMQSIVLKFHR